MSHTQVTFGPPLREVPGFGCPACGRMLPLEKLTGKELAYGLKCCGYSPTQDEAARWARAGQIIRARRI